MLKTYTPSKKLQPYVAYYYHINWNRKDYKSHIREFCLPSGYGYMGFQVRGRGYIEQKNKVQELPKFYFVGQQSQYYHFNSKDPIIDLYKIVFQPTGLWHFFGLDMPDCTDTTHCENSLFKNDIRNFLEEFAVQKTPKHRIELLETLLLKKFLFIQPRLNFIDRAIQLMRKAYGCCSIKKLTRQLNVSERYFQKKFKLMVGITPCAYNRIIRFNFMFAQMKPHTPADYQSLSVLFNYYDLPHFSNDFKKYCGACPSKFHVHKFKFLQELMIENASFVQLRESHS